MTKILNLEMIDVAIWMVLMFSLIFRESLDVSRLSSIAKFISNENKTTNFYHDFDAKTPKPT
jgi:hypothetical protein